MAALHAPAPRTPSPKLRIHRSQSFSFDSPSSRISVTPIDDSPYSKSTSAINAYVLPQYNALKNAEAGLPLPIAMPKVMLHTKISEDSIMSDASDTSSTSSSPTSPTSSITSEDERFGLFASSPGAPPISATSSPALSSSDRSASPFNTTPTALEASHYLPPQILASDLQIYQEESSSPMYDPWLVHVVLDMFDARGFDWMNIAEPIERIWGFRTCSADVLGILSLNGRVGRMWWD